MLLLLLAACRGSSTVLTTPPVATVANPDVVLFTVDTTRADRLGAYGYPKAATPTIDALARSGVRYARAYSTLPLTIPAHASMMTGLWPFHHHIRENGDNLLTDDFTTLAERFQQAGYDTGASVAAFVTTRQWGFAQGFDAYYDYLPESDEKNYWHTERPGNLVVDDALKWMDGHPPGTPVFLWVHLYDAHAPYVAHDGQPEELRARPYDAELSFVDAQIQRVLDAFQGRDPLVVVIGDHGESLGEHGERAHGLFNYDATQHVPWIISGAGVKPGVVEAPVSTVSLTATLLHAAGLPVPEGLDAGVAPSEGGTIYAETWQLASRLRMAPHRTVVDGNWKLIATPRPELYDLLKDPGELTNLADQHADLVAQLTGRLDQLGATPPGTGSSTMDADTISQLAALGYMASGDQKGLDLATLPDPKDYLDVIKMMENLEAESHGDPEKALAIFQEVVRRKPDVLEPRMRQVPLLVRLERQDEARALMEETANRFPDSPKVWLSLASMTLADGDKVGALDMARRAVTASPTDAAAQEMLVDLLFQSGQDKDGLAQATVFMEQNPRNFGLAAVLGRYHLFHQQFQEAVKYLAVAVAAPNPKRGARTQLAWLAIAAGEQQDAFPLLEAELKDYPRYVRAHKLLASLYGHSQSWAQQLPHLEAVMEGAPGEVAAMIATAQCLFNLREYGRARKLIDQALTLAPDEPDVLLLHANLLAKEGKKDEGKVVYERANALHTARLKATGRPLVEVKRQTAESVPSDTPPAPPVAP